MMIELYLRKNGFAALPGASQPSGVYALLRGKEVLYIGMSKNVHARVGNHAMVRRRGRPYQHLTEGDSRSKVIPFDRVLAKFCSLLGAKILESELIHTYCPPYNSRVIEPIRDHGIDLDALAKLAGIESWTAKEEAKQSRNFSGGLHRRFG